MPLNLATTPEVLSVGFVVSLIMHTDGQVLAALDAVRRSWATVQDHLLPGL